MRDELCEECGAPQHAFHGFHNVRRVGTSAERVPKQKPVALQGSWDDACAGCGYLPQHCECD